MPQADWPNAQVILDVDVILDVVLRKFCVI